MLIEMLETRRGSEDGHTVRLYNGGQKYDVTDGLAWDFVRKGYAKAIPTPIEEQIAQLVRDGFSHSFAENFVRTFSKGAV